MLGVSMMQQCPTKAWCCLVLFQCQEKVPDSGCGVGLGAGEVEGVEVLEGCVVRVTRPVIE